MQNHTKEMSSSYLNLKYCKITCELRTLWLDKPRFLRVQRHGWRHFHFVLEYRDMDDVTKTRKNFGFIKQIKQTVL